MKKLLVLAYEYWPTENANTRIIKNTCELLAKDFAIDLVSPASPQGSGTNGEVNVIRVPAYSFHRDQCTGKFTPVTLVRMLMEKAIGKLIHDDTRMLERMYERGIRKAVRLSDYDAVLSFSAPILAHGCASRIVRGTPARWLAVCFDPYFDHRIFGAEHLGTRKRREEKYMEPAEKVLVMEPTDRDYLEAGVAFAEKIVGFKVPGISPRGSGTAGPIKPEPLGPVCCGFFGSMYREIRDPRAAIALFREVAEDPKIQIAFAGHLEGFSAEELFPAESGIRYAGVLRGDELAKRYAETDVLINIGNSVDNQIPSKIFEYISTGKPIINIYKTPACPTLRYLTRYPLALNLSEADVQADLSGKASEVRAFILTTRGKRVPAEEIRKNFAENTFGHFAERIRRILQETEENNNR